MDQKAEPEPMDQKAEPEPMDQAPTTDGTMQPSTSQPCLTGMDEVFANNMVIISALIILVISSDE